MLESTMNTQNRIFVLTKIRKIYKQTFEFCMNFILQETDIDLRILQLI
jgi:hypothetical protein